MGAMNIYIYTFVQTIPKYLSIPFVCYTFAKVKHAAMIVDIWKAEKLIITKTNLQ